MANAQKFKRGACGHITAHFERRKDDQGEYIKFGNQEIDASRTPLNYNLGPSRGISQMEFIRRRTEQANVRKHASVNVMVSWVVTAPKGLPEAELNLFFRETYNFLAKRYGGENEKNVISAYVHMDETTPHIHFAFVPAAMSKRKGKEGQETVSAKDVLTIHELRRFHPELEAHLANVFGFEVGIMNEATKDGNKTIAELKKASIAEETEKYISQKYAEIQTIDEKLFDKQAELAMVEDAIEERITDLPREIETYTAQADSEQARVERLTARRKELSAEERTSLKPYNAFWQPNKVKRLQRDNESKSNLLDKYRKSDVKKSEELSQWRKAYEQQTEKHKAEIATKDRDIAERDRIIVQKDKVIEDMKGIIRSDPQLFDGYNAIIRQREQVRAAAEKAIKKKNQGYDDR